MKRVKLVVLNGEEAKECTKCGVVHPLTFYAPSKKGLGGRVSRCRDCRRAYGKKHYWEDPEKSRERVRQWHQENKEQDREYWQEYSKRIDRTDYQRNYDQQRKDKHLRNAYKKARQMNLPYHLTVEEYDKILNRFNYKCAYSESEDITIEHFIPTNIGHGGTVVGNVYPCDKWINQSKQDFNPFEWIQKEEIRKKVNIDKFNELVKYLAEENGMTVIEFKDYVYRCFDNPKEGKTDARSIKTNH